MSDPAHVRRAIRLLVVDDDEPIRTLIAAIFSRRGVVAELMASGAAALERLRRERFDVLILDLRLPGAGGGDVLRHLALTDPELLGRTVVITAMSPRRVDEFPQLAAVKRVIFKPFEVDQLVAAVLSCGDAVEESPLQQQHGI